MAKQIPRFTKIFNNPSIGIEAELAGATVALPRNSVREFGYVEDANSNPLFMLTKDMTQGVHNNYTKHTIELVSYPCETLDMSANALRKDAMLSKSIAASYLQ